jgi:hypothetical protein
MLNQNETHVCNRLSAILDEIAPDTFICKERKGRGRSSINKPADLGIYKVKSRKICLIAVEVAAVNTTQLTGEVLRLFYDSCPRKLLVLIGKHPGNKGITLCERIFCLLFGQDNITRTPARVVRYSNKKAIKKYLRSLLLI